MIHISIPSTQTLVEADGNRKYDAFDIYINGAYHASIRYSHLLKLHEKLCEHFGPRLILPDFPSRKFFRTLDKKALNERRLALARYFQAVMQQQRVAQHFITEHAFLSFQVESFRPSSSNVSVDVFMADGTKETIRCNVEHPTDIVLKRFAEQIGMNIENIGNFGLFLAKRRYNNSNNAHYISSVCSTQYPDSLCVRLLRNFESPYLSTHLLNQKSAAAGVFCYVTIRKLIWDPRIEEEMLDDPGALLLLYKQAVGDLHNGHFVPCQPEIKDRLLALEEQGNCLQFLRLCHLQPNYGYEVLEPCLSDYPRLNTECSLKVGRRHILLEFSGDDSKVILRAEFRASRIRVWRIAQQDTGDFTFQFEYLMSKEHFQWITLQTNQAIFLSLLLQSMGMEILKEHRNSTNTYGEYDYEYQTKNAFSFNTSQNSSLTSSPVISKISRQEKAVVNGIDMNPVGGREEARNERVALEDENNKKSAMDGSDPLTTSQSTNGNVRLSLRNNSGSTGGEKCAESSASGSSNKGSFPDLFTTISKALPARIEAFEITDDDL